MDQHVESNAHTSDVENFFETKHKEPEKKTNKRI